METVRLPARSPNLDAYAERFVRAIKSECLRRVVPLGERHLRILVAEYVERYHQGLGNVLIERVHQGAANSNSSAPIKCRQRLGGTLRYYYRDAT